MRATIQESLSNSIANSASTGEILKEYPNGDYEKACMHCKGAGMMPGSSLGCPNFCKTCKGTGFVLVRHIDKKVLAFDRI